MKIVKMSVKVQNRFGHLKYLTKTSQGLPNIHTREQRRYEKETKHDLYNKFHGQAQDQLNELIVWLPSATSN